MTALLQTDVIRQVRSTGLPDDADFERWSRAAYRSNRPNAVCISLVDDDESSGLNDRYRGKKGPTNVLSFPLELPEAFQGHGLGDLVICAPVVAREAVQQGKSVTAHWAHMVVHGMLHLQGYDHQSEREAREMEALEREILAGLGFGNPYGNDELA